MKCYVIFRDHYDPHDDYDWEGSYGRHFYNVAGTKEKARGMMENYVLGQYYNKVDCAELRMMHDEVVRASGDWDSTTDYLEFDVLEDREDEMVIGDGDYTDEWYYEEYDI